MKTLIYISFFLMGALTYHGYIRYRIYKAKKRFLRLQAHQLITDMQKFRERIQNKYSMFNDEPQNAVDSLLNEMNIKKQEDI
jgi:hypothetical protein